MKRPIQNTTQERVPLCPWCGRICYNESEVFCSDQCKREAIYADHELAPKPVATS